MKLLLTSAFLVLAAGSTYAATDADITIIKAQKVVIEENTVTIIAEASATITATTGDHQPGHKGMTWQGRPATRITIKADKATFTIRRPHPEVPLEEAWKMTLEAAKALQAGKEVGRIGFYAPEIVIKENLIHSINGPGFLFPKGH
jgi:hypothetical protein